MSVFLALLRWTARISGFLIACAYAVVWVLERTHPHSRPPSTFLEWAGIALATTACAAMLVAWRWELTGAILSLASLGAFAALIRGGHTFHMVIVVMAFPGILYALDSLARRGPPVRGSG